MAFPTGWDYYKEITISSADVDSNVTDFPWVVHITSDADLADHARNDGFDLVVTNSSATELPYERVVWNASTGELLFWFKADSLSSTVDNVFRLYYSNSSQSTDKADPTNVWTDYAGVWHMEESSGTRYDSTSNSNDLTENSSSGSISSLSGQIDQGVDLEKTDKEYLSITDASQTGLFDSGNITLSAWMKLEQLPSSAGDIMVPFAKDNITNRTISIQLESSGNIMKVFGFTDVATNYFFETDNALFVQGDVSNWVHVVVAIDIENDTATAIYKNASSQALTVSLTPGGAMWDDTAAPFEVGDRAVTSGSIRAYDGGIDELLIYDGILDSGDVTTLYNNQSDPTGSFTLGSEQVNTGTAPSTFTSRNITVI
jgi:hypothetical protein